MGSPLLTDAVSDVNAATLNQLIAAPGGKATVFAWYARVRYTGSAWETVSGTDSASEGALTLAWNGTNNNLEITLSEFAQPPVIVATPADSATAYNVKASASTNVLATLSFFDVDTGAQITTEDTDMDVNLIIMGAYV